MQLLDLPLVVRDDLERLGLDPSAPGLVIDADGNGVTLHLTHDQLTGFADRVELGAYEDDDHVCDHDDCAYEYDHQDEIDDLETDLAAMKAKLVKATAEIATRQNKACHLGHCARAGITS